MTHSSAKSNKVDTCFDRAQHEAELTRRNLVIKDLVTTRLFTLATSLKAIELQICRPY